MDIRLTPERICRYNAAIVVGLLGFHVALQSVRFATGNRFLFGLGPFFNVGADGNLPTYYSALSLLVSAILLLLIAVSTTSHRISDRKYWYALAAIFTFLSTDEMLQIHEHLIEPLRSTFGTSGIFYYAWVIPYGLGVLVLACVYLPFLLRLPRRTAILFVVAGASFVGGAIGIEVVSGLISEARGNDNPTYVALQTLEELLEMTGIVIFIYALADYIASHRGGLHLRITGQDRAAG